MTVRWLLLTVKKVDIYIDIDVRDPGCGIAAWCWLRTKKENVS